MPMTPAVIGLLRSGHLYSCKMYMEVGVLKESRWLQAMVAVGAGLWVSPHAWAHCSGDGECPALPELTSDSIATPSFGVTGSLPATSFSNVGAPGVFDIRFNFINPVTTAQQQAFEASAAFWESVIVGYQPGVALDGIEIDITLANIDGPGGTLGFGGFAGGPVVNQGGFIFRTDDGITQTGLITLDTSDFGLVPDSNVINHEVAHTLGFGTLFNANGLVASGGQFTGSNGLAAFQDEFDSSAAFVPLELDGGPGTALGHLDEDIVFNEAGQIIALPLTGITDPQGRDLSNELLTGVLGPDPSQTFLSNTTVAIFADLGFVVELPNVIPEPGMALLMLVGTGLLAVRRRGV